MARVPPAGERDDSGTALAIALGRVPGRSTVSASGRMSVISASRTLFFQRLTHCCAAMGPSAMTSASELGDLVAGECAGRRAGTQAIS